MHIAWLGVATFFMLSGACLTISTETKFDLKSYFKKRFTHILIPFYVTNGIYWLFYAITHGRLWVTDVPTWRITFTLLGVDEWLSMHGIRTFSSGIGEWFLGEIVILYLLFQILRWSMRKCPKLFFTLCLAIYGLTVLLFKREIPHFSLN